MSKRAVILLVFLKPFAVYLAVFLCMDYSVTISSIIFGSKQILAYSIIG